MSTPSAFPSADKNVLQFNETMAQFDAMFPHLGPSTIETVLRKYDGDVSATVDELLRRSGGAEEDNSPAAQTKGKHQRKAEQKSSNPQDPCANDEKIALLIQNREFLRYLRRDPHFQRELLGSFASNHRNGRQAHGHHSSRMRHREMPVLLASSRPSHSPNTQRLFRTPNGVTSPAEEEAVCRVPDGPSVESRAFEQELALPDGPLIDYVYAGPRASGWAQRLKARFTTAEKGPSPVNYELMSTPSLAELSDEEIRARIGGMGGGGKRLLIGLARKFGQMTKSGVDTLSQANSINHGKR